jgi:hypothetical protein
MRHEGVERTLLISISEEGIRDPLEGVNAGSERILLNGFKRYRCAQKLGIKIVPYTSLGSDEVFGIIQLIRISNAKSLSILEQAKLIEDLRKMHKMSVADIAGRLERSKGWVSMRIGLVEEISECVLDKILNGKFPVYSYMYTLRQFIRMNFTSKKEVDEFVDTVAGKRLSIREIEQLAHGYFRGSEEFRMQIKSGNLAWGLKKLKESDVHSNECNEMECGMLKDLEIIQKYMQKTIYKSKHPNLKNKSFFAQVNILAGGILRQRDIFFKTMEELYVRSGKM